MRFVDFLKATVLLSGGGATALAILTVVSGTNDQDEQVVLYMAGWWLAATLIGSFIGRRRNGPSPQIADLLADSRTATMFPEIHPAAVLLNRLWPLVLAVLLSAALSFLAPQIPGIATGFAIIWALAWRHQDKAVTAIEERDGVVFFIEKTAFYKPMKLERMPGFKREVPT